MSITTLGGVINADVYVDGYVPHGPEVVGDFNQIINKLNEVIAQLNTNTAGIATNVAVLASHSTLIQANYDDLAAYELSNDALVTAIDARVTVVEASTSNSQLTINSTTTLTVAQATENRFINVQDAGGGGTPDVFFPLTGSLPSSYPPVTVMNNGFTTVNVKIGDGTAGLWADGTGGNYQIPLSAGESVTLYPYDEDGATTFEWGIIGGKSYSDLTVIS